MRRASIITTVPVALSVAPDEPSHESKWALSMMYSLGRRAPRISAMVLETGTVSPVNSARVSTRSMGLSPLALSR